MVEGFTLKNFFQLGVYEGAKKQKKKNLIKEIFYLKNFAQKINFKQVQQAKWSLEVYSKLLLKGA